MNASVTATIKMYRVGELGDCFLLQFKEKTSESHVLIDCGSFRNRDTSKKRLTKVVSDITTSLKGKKIDVVVGTHQHNDHLSGYTHCESMFQNLVEQVWLSWLDNPKDAFARKIQREQKNLVQQLKGIYTKMTSIGIQNKHQAVNDVLGFFGVSGNDPEIPALGIEALKNMGAQDVKYLSPGEHFSLPGLSENVVRVYVLGPPRNKQLLFDKDPSKGESYDLQLAVAEASASKILSALDNQIPSATNKEEEQFPFAASLKKKAKAADARITSLYNNRQENYRKIDSEWLSGADRLALYLDSYTNNSSLVLAFELVKSGKVLLFAADAQTGNWLSWEDIKWDVPKNGFTTNSLLENTVLYKVGHHGSHNATLVQALESMNHPELVAMIPVDKTDPNITKPNGWKMPAKNLYKRLKEKTSYRVLRMDDGFADECDPVKNKSTSKWKDLPFKPKFTKNSLFIEYTIQG